MIKNRYNPNRIQTESKQHRIVAWPYRMNVDAVPPVRNGNALDGVRQSNGRFGDLADGDLGFWVHLFRPARAKIDERFGHHVHRLRQVDFARGGRQRRAG